MRDPHAPPVKKLPRGKCRDCGKPVPLRVNGTAREHWLNVDNHMVLCSGSAKKPA